MFGPRRSEAFYLPLGRSGKKVPVSFREILMAKQSIPKEFDPEGFAAFWARFPRRQAKVDAYKAWRQKQPSAETQREIHAALDWQIPALKWDGEPQYCLLPASYLRGERWTDERRQSVRLEPRRVGQRDMVPAHEPL